jgi:hypothetical protein
MLRDLKLAEPGPMPEFIEPLFPQLRDRPPNGDNWVHEIKFDGYRFQLRLWHQKAQRRQARPDGGACASGQMPRHAEQSMNERVLRI